MSLILKGRKAAVLGAGQSGISAALALKRAGAHVFLSESRPRSDFDGKVLARMASFKCEFGGHGKNVLNADLIVVSPGIHLDLPIFKRARVKKIPILSELELGWRLGNFKRVAAVTGTNGKTTTASLLGHMCRTAGFKTIVAGNIGRPLCDFIQKAMRYERTVLEVSSYQLESSILFRPDVACVLNLTADHLERHRTLNAYASAKKRIFMNQGSADIAVLNQDDPRCRKMKTGLAKAVYISTKKSLREGVFLDDGLSKIRYRCLGKSGILPLPAHLPGLHNIENACAAAAMALALKVSPKDISKSLENFRGVPHRLETVKTVRGITFINDSKATNVDSTEKALQAISGHLWLILGGQDKGAPYKPLVPLIRQKVKGIYLIGEAAGKIEKDLRGAAPFFHSGTLANAVKDSYRRAMLGDAVLLSPACASFDQFKNFEDRGEQFKSRVGELKP